MNGCLTRRSFLQTTGLALAACSCQVHASPTADSANRVPRQGVVPAALTPFDAELRIARNEFRRHIEALSAVPGVTAIMVNGAAGQDAALSREERRTLVAEAAAAVGDRTPIIAAVRETQKMTLWDLATDAAAEGAHAVLIMPPPDKNDAEWEQARARFSHVVDATDLPVAIYQVGYSTETLTRLAQLTPVFAIGAAGDAFREYPFATVQPRHQPLGGARHRATRPRIWRSTVHGP